MDTVILSKSTTTSMLLPKPSTFSSPTPPRHSLSLSKTLRSQWRLRRRSRFASSPSEGLRVSVICGVREIDEKEFPNAVLSSDRPVLVEFVATWCAPCRLITPFMEWLAQEYEDRMTIVKIDHDVNSNLIKEYQVYGLPTLILFKNGKEVPGSRREGAISKAKLQEYVEALLV